jgi:hypothetical protein
MGNLGLCNKSILTMKNLFVIALASLSVTAMAGDLPVEDLRFSWQGRRFECRVTVEEVLATSAWVSSNEPNPPLAPGRAVHLARGYTTNLVAYANMWTINKISLIHVTENRWIYEITFLPSVPEQYSGPHAPLIIVVLMNGTVARYRELEPAWKLKEGN